MEIRVIVLFILVTQFCVVHSTVDKPLLGRSRINLLDVRCCFERRRIVGIVGEMHEKSIRKNWKENVTVTKAS